MDKRTACFILEGTLLVMLFCCVIILSKSALDKASSKVSSAEAKATAEQYSDYGYTQEELDLITEDIELGRDVSLYVEKNQSSEEFINARNVMLASEKENSFRTIAIGAFAVVVAMVLFFVDVTLSPRLRYLD